MGYECNREITPQEATKEQLEERIKDALEHLKLGMLTGDSNSNTTSKCYLELAIITLETGFPF